MSGEFGSYVPGYFHNQMEVAADDLATGHSQLTKEWGRFFREFTPIARAISWDEASDSGPWYPIKETIDRLDRLKEALSAIESYVSVYKQVADEAVENYIRKQLAT